MISVHDHAGVEALARRMRMDPYRLRRFRAVFHKRQGTDAEALRELPANLAAGFAAEVDLHPLVLEAKHDSQRDGATKLLFRTRGGQVIETVILRIATGRTTLCLSTQAGCGAACAFCATGKLGLSRNLTAAEMADQVVQANQMLRTEGRQIRNVVFMGMGEPLHNEAELYRVLEQLSAPEGVHLDLRRMLVSTVGVADALLRCATRFPRLGLALSLHSARAAVRERLMPVARRYSLDALRAALEGVTAAQGKPPMIEYLLLEGVNDTEADVVELGAFLRGLEAHVNLIPYNAIAGAEEFVGTGPARRAEFAAGLRGLGFKVTTRYSLGGDIAAACGQLARAKAGPAAVAGVAVPRV